MGSDYQEPNFEGSSFSRAEVDPHRRLIVAVDGHQKHGKTHWALTAPKPLAIVSLDHGLEGVVEKHEWQQVYPSRLHEEVHALQDAILEGRPPVEIAKTANVLWQRVVTDVRVGLRECRTVVVDTATNAYEILRWARFGKLTQVLPEHYGPVNMEWEFFIREAYNHQANLILIHRLKAEYVNAPKEGGKRGVGEKTGRFVRAGQKDTGFLVQVNATAFKDEGGYQLRVDDCRPNPELEGVVLPEVLNTFVGLATMVYPETGEGEWG